MIGLASGALAAAIGAPQVALAAPPANDNRADAIVVVEGDLPYTDSVDTSEATPQANDPECASDPETNPTVWYRFTAGANDTYGVTTFGSDYDTTLWVGTANGGLTEIGCSDDVIEVSSAVVWDAQAGQEYLIMAGACCGQSGGQLELRIERDPARETLDLTIAPRGTFNKAGAAVISGTLECSGSIESAVVEVSVSQRAGRVIIRGFSDGEVGCGDRWQVLVPGDNGLFKGGNVQVDVSAFGGECGPFGCTFGEAHRTVRLSGKRR